MNNTEIRCVLNIYGKAACWTDVDPIHENLVKQAFNECIVVSVEFKNVFRNVLRSRGVPDKDIQEYIDNLEVDFDISLIPRH